MKSNKKGFTIVELVIVIAIIAILAAVLIPTFASLVKKANVSADTQLVRNLNMAVEIEKASSNAKHSTMHEALMTAQDAGYDVDTIVAKSGYNIAWDSANDRFVLVDKDAKKYIYPTSENTAENSIGNPADYFLFCDDSAKIDESGFSFYLSKNAKLPTDGTVTVKAGFDSGENKNLKEVTYNGNATKVIFNLNGGKLTVTDTTANNQQYFYGSLAEAEISTGNACFHAYGTVAKLNLQAGKVVAEAGSIVVVSKAASGTVVAKSSGSVVMKAEDVNNFEGTVDLSTEDEKKAYTLEISDAAGLAAFRDSVNSGMTYAGLTVKLTADIDLSTQGNWNPIGNRYALDDKGTPVDTNDTKVDNKKYRKAFMGTFDGQGHTIIGLLINTSDASYKGVTKEGVDSTYAALFGYVDKATVKNFTVNGLVAGCDVAGVIGILGEGCTVDGIVSNVTVGGKTGENEANSARGKVGGIVNMTKGDGSTISNCTNKGAVSNGLNSNNEGDFAGGIIALIQNKKITIKNCKNMGDVTSAGKTAGGIVGLAAGQTTIETDDITAENALTITYCENTGAVANTERDYAGAIIGMCGSGSRVKIISCKNTDAKNITSGKNTFYDSDKLVGQLDSYESRSDNKINGKLEGVTKKS